MHKANQLNKGEPNEKKDSDNAYKHIGGGKFIFVFCMRRGGACPAEKGKRSVATTS